MAEALRSPCPSGKGLGWGSTASPEASPTPGPSPKAEGGKMKNAGIPDNRIVFSEKFACPVSGFTISELEPRLFSFNAPKGPCPACHGMGEKPEFDTQPAQTGRAPLRHSSHKSNITSR